MVYNTAQNSSENHPPYPSQNQHIAAITYCKAGILLFRNRYSDHFNTRFAKYPKLNMNPIIMGDTAKDKVSSDR